MINYLRQGGLVGAKPAGCISSRSSLDRTMTGEDITNGNMIVSMRLAVSRPAEFIVITIIQKMETPKL